MIRGFFVGRLGVGLLAVWTVSLPAAGAGEIDLAAPVMVRAEAASGLEIQAARELQRYLYRVSEHVGPIVTDAAVPQRSSRTMVLLDVAGNNRLAAAIEQREGLAVDVAALGEEGFRWKATRWQGNPVLVIAAARPVGVLRGVYALLEKLGFGFYLGGDALPARGSPLVVGAALDESHQPVFAIRGTLPWGNLLNAYWDLEDWKFYFDQLAKQGYNFVGLHQYSSPLSAGGEPWCAYEWEGKLVAGSPMLSSLVGRATGDRGLKTEQFGFGTGEYYDRDPFTQRVTLEGKDPDDKVRRSQRMLAAAFAYAHTRGIKVCLGFGIGDDPTTNDYPRRLEAQIVALLKNYPMLDYVWFFQEENQGAAGWKLEPGSPQAAWVAARSQPFKYLGTPERVAEGVRLNQVCQMAYRIVNEHHSGLPIIISGWGGDQYMRCNDYDLGLDKTLPQDVIFGCMDNIDPRAAPTVSEVYRKLPLARGRWPIPWWNNDGYSLWDPQCTTQPLVPLCRDAYDKKCQGMLAIHWLTREVEEVAAYQAQFAWNPGLTYEQFYDAFATRCYGEPWAKRMSQIHRDLEALGPRWTGAGGETDIRAAQWLVKDHTSIPGHREKLTAIRAELERIRREMHAAKRREGIERVDWLLTTIDWLTRYDDACLKLSLDGPLGHLLQEAETARKAGDLALARNKADTVRGLLLQSGFREAIQTYPRKLSAMSEFGEFASIQIKAYAFYLSLWERVKQILGAVPDDLAGPPVPAGTAPFIVGKEPSSILEPARDFPVNAVVMSGTPIVSCTLCYRTIGQTRWKRIPMAAGFRRTYTASIPAADLSERAVEWFVEAKDQAKAIAYWPRGYPDVVWSASIRRPPAGGIGADGVRKAPDVPARAFEMASEGPTCWRADSGIPETPQNREQKQATRGIR